MSAATLDRAMTEFARLADLPADEQHARLQRLDAESPSLADEVRSLLGYHDRTTGLDGGFLDPGALARDLDAIRREPLEAGMRFAGCTVIAKIGTGGSSVVYLAEQERPRRSVALKVLSSASFGEGAGGAVLARLEREADLLARIDCPSVAQIYAAGVEDLGAGEQAYLLLEYVPGLPIDEHCRAAALGPRERVALFSRVVEAIRAAHRAGVVHLDIKPANVLVRGDGAVKVLDFGIARGLHEGDAQGPVGATLAYVAPEQVTLGMADTLCDVYSLGVVLFELLAGKRPLDMGGLPAPEWMRRIGEEPRLRLEAVRPDLGADLDSVLAVCLAVDRASRYQSVVELADDLDRYLSGKPVRVRQESALESLTRSLKRGRRVIAASSVVMVALAATAGVAVREARRSTALQRSESSARRTAEMALSRADAEAELLRDALYDGSIGHAGAAIAAGESGRAREILQATDPELRRWEWSFLRAASEQTDAAVATLPAGNGDAAASPDGRFVAVCRQFSGVALVDLESRGVVATNAMSPCTSVAYAHDGASLLVGVPRGSDVRLDARTLEVVGVLPTADSRVVRVDPSGRWYVSIDHGHTVRVIDVRSGACVATPAGPDVPWPVHAAAWSPNGERLALGGANGGLVVLDAETWMPRALGPGPAGLVRDAAFSPDGGRVAAVGHDTALHVYDVSTGARLVRSRPGNNKLSAVAWARDGESVYVGGTETLIQQIGAADGVVMSTFRGHPDTVGRIAVTAKGRIASVGIDAVVRLWPAEPREISRSIARTTSTVRCLAWMDGLVLLGDVGGSVTALAASSGEVRWRRDAGGGAWLTMSRVAAGAAIGVTADEAVRWIGVDGEMRVIGRVRAGDGGHGVCSAAAFSADGRWLARGYQSGRVTVTSFSVTDAEGAVVGDSCVELREGRALDAVSAVRSMAWCAAGDGAVCLVSADDAGEVFSWRMMDGRATAPAERANFGRKQMWAIAADLVSREPRAFASTESGDVLAFNPVTLQPLAELRGHRYAVYSASFSPDGSRLYTGGYDNTMRVWNTRTLAPLLTLRGHLSSVHGIAVSSDGRVVTTSDDGDVRVWGEDVRRFGADAR